MFAAILLILATLSVLLASPLHPVAAGLVTSTATPSPTICPMATPEPLWVEPVLSPTDRLTQTVVVNIGNGEAVTVTTASGVFAVAGNFAAAGSPAHVPIDLLPGVVHDLTVAARVRTMNQGGCPFGGYTLTTQQDRNGVALRIVQQGAGVTQGYLPLIERSAVTPAPTLAPTLLPTPTIDLAPRPWPDTNDGIQVFNDQLAPNLSDEQWRFAATHYAGVQKMTRRDADTLRRYNPDLLILHYRLGLALGYRSIENGCQPTGDFIHVVEGNQWVQEWPGDGIVDENWFAHWPQQSTTRVLNCDWGWWLMAIDDPGWRAYWHDEVLRQVQANDNDGIFMDSLSTPNYLGADRYDPALPPIDAGFEADWAEHIDDWLTWLQTQPVGVYAIIPNVGSWVTTRDPTTYTAVDGVMIEGFAMWGEDSPFAVEDWQLQMNRALGLIRQDKAVIAQTYPGDGRERLFALGSYLLIKGGRTFLNLEVSIEPEWWPEYEIDIGNPLDAPVANIDELERDGVYRRDFTRGFVLVNPVPDGPAITVALGGSFWRVLPAGGGEVLEDGIPTGVLGYETVDSVSLPPYSAAVLLPLDRERNE
jgi:hypothetical protein